MPDQAQSLRKLAGQSRQGIEVARTAVVGKRNTARTISVTSGKGGVGKTSFAANLAVLFARSGQHVAIIDADLGLANVHLLLGMTPVSTLEDVLHGGKGLREIITEGPEGIRIIAGASGVAELANLGEASLNRFLCSLSELDDLVDIIVVDTGAGVTRASIAFAQAAEETIVIVTPEPTSIADAYATIKLLLADDPEAKIKLVVNMAKSHREACAVAERMRLVSRRFLKSDIEVLGYVPIDRELPAAVHAQQLLCISKPDSPAARAIASIATALGYDIPRSAGVNRFLNRLVAKLGADK